MKTKTLYKNIKIPSIEKDSLIKDSKLFKWIDSDFENYGTSETYDKNVKAKTFEVREIEEDGTFKQIFNDPENQWMTQGQVLQFIENNKEKLSPDCYTFFLFKSCDKFFVADVFFNDDGSLKVSVDRFEDGSVWLGSRHRMVFPQLDSENLEISDTETLESFETLSEQEMIDALKEKGYKITKMIEKEF
jgi:hypothetical protein